MSKKMYLVPSVVFGMVVVAASFSVTVNAESTEVQVEAAAAASVQTTAVVSADTAVSITSTESEESSEEKVPSPWGMFFLGLRERITLMTTFDPVARTEKALEFAEKRTRIAEGIAAKTDDPRVAERVEKMLERAAELEERAGEQKEKLLENPDDRAKLALKNLLNFQEKKEALFERLESKFSPEQLERFESMRTAAEEKGKSLLEALKNTNLPEDVRVHLEEVKARIEEHRGEVVEFRTEQKELLDRIKEGDESAKEELKTLREDRKVEIKENIDVRQESRADESGQKRMPLLERLHATSTVRQELNVHSEADQQERAEKEKLMIERRAAEMKRLKEERGGAQESIKE